jgi:lipopolysaccharide export system protein LptC
MKKLVLAMALLSVSTLAYSQEKKEKEESVKVPSAVEKAFQKAFPNTKAEWEDENGKFEGSFKYKGEEMSVVYNAQGVLEEKETEIKANQLPAAVSSYITKNKLGKIKEAAKIVKADGTVLYEAEVDGGDALFDSKGKFVKLQKD